MGRREEGSDYALVKDIIRYEPQGVSCLICAGTAVLGKVVAQRGVNSKELAVVFYWGLDVLSKN